MERMPNHTIKELFELLAAKPERRRSGAILNEIMERYKEPLAVKIRYHIDQDNAGLVEEVLQDVFIAVWRRRGNKEVIQNPENWLMTVCRNKAVSALRTENKQRPHQVAWKDDYMEIPENHPLFDKVLYRDIIDLVREEVTRLPLQRRKVYMMSKFDDLSIAAIANMLNLDRKTVKNHLGLAKEELKEKIGYRWKEGWQ